MNKVKILRVAGITLSLASTVLIHTAKLIKETSTK